MTTDVKNTKIIKDDGTESSLGEYAGQVLLIVNVASYCGFTAQYKDLQKLQNFRHYHL